nr:MAG TPA: hypothetical protein [Caudoviricetes sp.]
MSRDALAGVSPPIYRARAIKAGVPLPISRMWTI